MSVTQDLRYAVRILRRTPSVTIPLVLSIALGVGANTAIFSVVNTLMLRQLPVSEPGRLYQVLHAGDAGPSESANYSLYEQLRPSGSIADALQYKGSVMKVAVDGQAEALHGQLVTGNYFSMLGVTPHIGRLIGPEDESPGTQPVAVVSHQYWTRRFGRDPAVVGRTIVVEGVPCTVIGVTRADFFGLQVGRRVDVSVPIDGTQHRTGWLSMPIVVRLVTGVSAQTAEAGLDGVFQQYLRTQPIAERSRVRSFRRLELASVSTGLPEFRKQYLKPLVVLTTIVGVLLLLACTNLATLLLARAMARQRELSVRLALGASRRRLAQMLLAESLIVSLAGGLLGLLAASWGVDLLIGYLPERGLPLALQVTADTTVLLFTLAVSVATGLIIGIAPAWLASRVQLADAIAANGRSPSNAAVRFNKSMAVAQVALSLWLLAGATLFAASLRHLQSRDPGFTAENVLMVALDVEGTGFEGDRLPAVQRQLLERLKALPGVRHATLAKLTPLSGSESGKPIAVQGFTPLSDDVPVAQVNAVAPEYFEAFGVRILSGRGIRSADAAGAPPIAVISESMARFFFGGSSPIGRRLDVGRGSSGGRIEIVGVANDVKYRDLKSAAAHVVYVPFDQMAPEERFVVAVRTTADAAGMMRVVEREVKSAVPAIPIVGIKTLERQKDETLVNERLLATLSGFFGLLALAITATGIYGLVSYSVTRRLFELGLRIALGARRRQVLWLVLRGTLLLVGLGVVIGLSAAVATSTLASTLLFGVQPHDRWVYWASGAALGVVSLAAAGVPAIHASRIEPIVALRCE